MILKLEFAGRNREQCFKNLKENIARIEKQIMEERVTCCFGMFRNTGFRFFTLNNSGKILRGYKKK